MRPILATASAAAAAAVAAALVASAAVPASAADGEPIGGPLLTGAGVIVQSGAAPLPDIVAETWLLADATDGTVLAAKGPHILRPPASTLKTLTALTLLPRLQPTAIVVGSDRAATTGGAHVGIAPGQRYTVQDLFYGLMLPSGNDAAIALSEANGGVRRTVREMNAVARALQANDTVAKTPNGLHRPGQVSSAYDLALIARAGLARPDFARIVRTKTYEFPSKGGGTHTIVNQNRLLMGGYRGTVGVKTGFTTEAGRTFVGAATRKGHTLIFVGMGITEHSAAAAAKALTWGFKNLGRITPIGTLVAPATAPAAAASPEARSQTAAPIDLASAGLAVPSRGDPMAPWWFWVLVITAVVIVFVLWRAYRTRTSERHRSLRRQVSGTKPTAS